uniref:Fibronectin type-III domain-containing protein n=1 Tax=Paramormyrops kingsleyae TaxID=1676925 RepID=A0A3B3R8L5_9TELE
MATKTTVLLTWEFPETRSVEYKMDADAKTRKLEVDARLRKAQITGLRPNTTYDFKITSPEGNMGGLRHRIHAKTAPSISVRKPELDHNRDTDASLTIIFPPLEIRDSIR